MAYNRKAGLPGSGGSKRTRKQRTSETAREQAEYNPGLWFSFPNSSRVFRARYDPGNLILEVQWQDGGMSYVYTGVPSNVWANMRRVVSVGKFVNRVLNQYPYAPKVD